MFLVSLAAATVAGGLTALGAYALGFSVLGIALAYALVGNITFAVIIALLTSSSRMDDIDFQQQVELDLLALKLELMRKEQSGKRVSLFSKDKQTQDQHRAQRRSRVVPRPVRPAH